MQVIKLTAFSSDSVCDLSSYPLSVEECHRRCFPAAASEVHQVGIMQSQDADTSTCWHQLQSTFRNFKTKGKAVCDPERFHFLQFSEIYIYLLCVINSDPKAVD